MESLIQKANKVMDSLNGEISDFIKEVKDKSLKQKQNQVPKELNKYIDKSILYKPCPTTENVPNLDIGEQEMVRGIVEEIKQEINKEPYKFLTEEDTRDESDMGSKEYGGKENVIELIYVQEPKWMKEIKAFCKNFKRAKGREYYDEEMMVRGRLSKKKAKTKSVKDDLYVLLDVSGSMWYYSFQGVPLIKLFSSYIPIFASKFDGHWVQSDGHVTHISDLKSLKSNFEGKMSLRGMGGADYLSAIAAIVAHSQKKYKVSEPTIVLFTDMAEVFPNPMPNNILLCTTSNKVSHIGTAIKDKGFPSEAKNQKIVLIQID